jgi:5'-nucleotidase
MKKETWYVDMDDTLCKFVGQAYLDLKANPSIKYPQSVYGFFTKLKPHANAVESMKEMVDMGLDVWILTRPSVLNPLCYTEKRVWVEQHLGLDFCDRLILCPDKGRVGDENDFLIDDYNWKTPKNPKSTPWKGTQLLFGQAPYENWDKVMEFIRTKYENKP